MMRLTQNQKAQYRIMVTLLEKNYFAVSASRFPHVILCPDLMTVQISKRKAPHIYKELIRRIVTFLLKLPQNKVVSNIVITGKKEKTTQTHHICQGHFKIELLISQMSQ